MIVDDEKEFADLIEAYLKNDGYEVFKFYNAKDALNSVFKKLLMLLLVPDSSYYNENIFGIKSESLDESYNIVVLYKKYDKEFLICSLGSESDTSRYDDINYVLKTIDNSDF